MSNSLGTGPEVWRLAVLAFFYLAVEEVTDHNGFA